MAARRGAWLAIRIRKGNHGGITPLAGPGLLSCLRHYLALTLAADQAEWSGWGGFGLAVFRDRFRVDDFADQFKKQVACMISRQVVLGHVIEHIAEHGTHVIGPLSCTCGSA